MRSAAERGTTTIADRAVRRIAGQAAREAIGERGAPRHTAVAQAHGEVRLELDVELPYSAALAEHGARAREHTAHRTQELTGLTVGRTDMVVSALAVPPEPAVSRAPGAGGDEGRTPGGVPSSPMPPKPVPTARRSARPSAWRPWSPRRVPATMLALLGALASGVVLQESIGVRTGRRPASWHRELTDRVTAVRLDDRWVAVAGAVLAVAGLWLLLLALTPGLRRRMPMLCGVGGLLATIDRGAVAQLVRDAALAVPGVTGARVSVGRRRVRVTATVGFGDLAESRRAVVSAVGEKIAELRLARPPRSRVRVVRSSQWREVAAGAEGPTTPRPVPALSSTADQEASQP